LEEVDYEKYLIVKKKFEEEKKLFYISVEEKIEAINDPTNRSNFISLAQIIQEDIFNKNPDFFSEIMSENYNYKNNNFNLSDFDDLLNTITTLINSLEVNYNDDIANKLFNAVHKSHLPINYKKSIFYKLIAFTKFTPNDLQTKVLPKNFLKHNHFFGTLDDLYKDKASKQQKVNKIFNINEFELKN
jgi:hypothetical protein